MADKEQTTGPAPEKEGLRLVLDPASSSTSIDLGSRSASAQTSAQTSPLTMEFKLNDKDEKLSPTVSKFSSMPRNVPPPPEEKRNRSIADEEEDGNDDEALPQPFERTMSPTSDLTRNKGAEYGKVGDQGVCKMHKFSLYETATRYFIVGADVVDRRFRILKVDRTAEPGTLNIAEDEIVYTKKEMNQLLNAIDDGNKSTGGMKLKSSIWGILGFIRFTSNYYMLVVTKRSQIAMISGHLVYQVDGIELIPLTAPANSRFKPEIRTPEETRFLSILNNLDLTRSFYFSYSYNITRVLQHNITTERAALEKGTTYPHPQNYNSMFVWNNYLLQPALEAFKNTYDWCLPVIHGYINQSALSIFGRSIHITLIARRSRHFAGARFLKRGVNDEGYVANDVETEQIVADAITTSFHAPGPKLFASPNFTSYVQHRGSIPLYWTQENNGVTPKPPIDINLIDPFYSAAALHFDNLFERYGAPIYALNLVKSKERVPREWKLLDEYTNAINYLNQFLPPDKKIIHKAWDMSRANKSNDQEVIRTLESIAETVLTTTGFFHNGDGSTNISKTQNGIARTNCIDCLDRTNAAQFVIGKRALAHQLHALGIISSTSVDYDTDTINLLTHMYRDHGDTIAVQYGGSQLVNTMETYRKTNQWTSHSRDMVESFKRYYNNSFLDGQRQEAYNLFLGSYIYTEGQPLLWDLTTDYCLHFSNPRNWATRTRRSYIDWFTPAYLEKRVLPDYVPPQGDIADKPLRYFDDYWQENYKPLAVSSLLKVLTYPGKMNSTSRYISPRHQLEETYDLSPFKVRVGLEQDQEKKQKKMVTILDPNNEKLDDDTLSIRPGMMGPTKLISLHNLFSPHPENLPAHHLGGLKARTSKLQPDVPPKVKLTALDKSRAAQWSFQQLVHESLNPTITAEEISDYEAYANCPESRPLITGQDATEEMNTSYQQYTDWVSGKDIGKPMSNVQEYEAYAAVMDTKYPLTALPEDLTKKRYKAYGKWLMGKSLFKQQPN